MRQHRSESFIAPKLPKSILDQVENGGSSKRNRNAPTRKERRKQDRQQKKQQNRPKMRPTPSLNRREQIQDDDETDPDEYEYSGPPPKFTTKLSTKAATTDADGAPIKSILKRTKKADPKSDSRRVEGPEPDVPRLSRAVRDKLADDDAEIAALEKKLGLKGKKSKSPKSFEDDGLDDLLEGLDGDDEDSGNKKRKRSEDDEWLKQKRMKVQQKAKKDDVSDDEDEEEEEDMQFDDEDDEDEDGSIGDDMDMIDGLLDGLGEDSGAEDDDDMEGLDGEEDDLSDDDNQDMDDDLAEDDEDGFESFGDDDEDEGEDDDDDDEPEPAPKKQRENPYIAPVTATTASKTPAAPAGKYVPPSLRGPPSSDAEALQHLRRQLQGLLNRLSEANLISILQSVEKIYADNPRQYVTSTLIDLLIGLICDRTTLQDTFLILHAGFIAAIYKVVGIDFGAQVIERIVNNFDKHYSPDNDETAGKETANLMSLLSELYNFGVVGGNLVFDYIRLFLNTLSEANTELLLRVIRNSGPQLRSEDPSALKDIVVLLQKQVTVVGGDNLSVRTKFMIETINSLKNNRMKTGAAASAIVSEHTTRMKKTIGTLNNRSTLKASEPLRIGLSDIRDTDKKGKWWLVGASWMDPGKHATTAKEEEQERKASASTTAVTVDTSVSASEGTTDLLTLARQQGMNTDIRRAIFVTIMSASDFKDANVRLLKLNFKKAQQLEIPRVLMHCVGAENVYNPYYTLIAKALCGEKRMVKAFQFGLWDLFKRMGERDDEDSGADDEDDADEDMGTRKIVNLAKFFAHLIVDAGLSITCLKVSPSPNFTPFSIFFTNTLEED